MMFIINKEKCLKCGMCVSVCPRNALKLTEQGVVRDAEKCINCGICGICEKFCPAKAIKVKK